MKTQLISAPVRSAALWFCVGAILLQPGAGARAAAPALEAGLARVDVSPEQPIWLAGYAARKKPSAKVESPLTMTALALRDAAQATFVFVALDNCEISGQVMAPTLKTIESKHGLKPGAVMIVNSHTHSAPVGEGALMTMYQMQEEHRAVVKQYGQMLQSKLATVVASALADLKPATLEHGVGRATFAMNRRSFKGGQVNIGENPEGPVDWEVPVLRIKGADGAVRGIAFGYACHATSIAGDDFYFVSPDYPGYARQHLEAVYPGALALFLTGMGADSNPHPRGTLLASKRHGLELAGAVAAVLDKPMRAVPGPMQFDYEEVELPLENPPAPEQIEQHAKTNNIYLQNRAKLYLDAMAQGRGAPTAVKLPLSVVRLGHELTFIALGGEVLVDYAQKCKRLFAADHPWTIGYAYDIPCYIPTAQVIKEGGYEPDSSLIYYGLYGPFKLQVDEIILSRITRMLSAVKAR